MKYYVSIDECVLGRAFLGGMASSA